MFANLAKVAAWSACLVLCGVAHAEYLAYAV